MKMTNIFITLLLALVVASPLVMAEDTNGVGTDSNQVSIEPIAEISIDSNNSVDTNTQSTSTDEGATELETHGTSKEVGSMKDGVGADIRLLQLERNITRNILRGQIVLSVVTTNHPDYNALTAQALLDDMQSLAQQAQAAPRTPVSDAVAAFVSIKKDALEDAKAFRDALRSSITDADRNAIKAQLKDVDRNELKAISDEIESTIRQHNADHIADILTRMGLQDQNFLDRIRTGDINMGELKRAFIGEIKDKEIKNSNEAGRRIREFNAQQLVEDKSFLRNAKNEMEKQLREGDDNRLARIAQRLENRGKNLDDNGFEHIADWVQKRADALRNMEQRINERPEGNSPRMPFGGGSGRGPGRGEINNDTTEGDN